MNGPASAALRAAGLALVGGALVLVALTFDSVTLFVPGLGLIAIAALAAGWAAAVRLSLRVAHAAPRTRTVEGEQVEVVVEIARRVLRPRHMFLQDPLAGGEHRLTLPGAPATVHLQLTTSFPRRGRVRLPQPVLHVTDPLGLVTLARCSTGREAELLVLPAIEPVRWPGGLLAGTMPGERHGAGHEPIAGLEVDGLRPYRPGTPASRIHWPSLARGYGLMERRLQADADELPLVLLDPASPRSSGHLDLAVRAAASLTLDLARRGGCRLMVAGASAPLTVRRDLAGWPAAHELLALVEADDRRWPGQLVAAAARRLLVVCAELPQRLGRLEHGTVIWVLPDDLLGGQAKMPLLRVSGCSGLGALEGERLAA